ncbi:vitamin B12 transporter BtuB [Glycocaulis alkaliphilus]|uniref:Vitamin B12 transporter BtuB n=1 Tax=Glycocaulis alkaliphilus TaxID=1434191 RepID=A0A3T0E8J8_9PROT|nr:TonB-dependent receptor [Glycocaulis alkaliphilus]AZU03458.1 vitamin B12 transporter BtuB [Glycocaulis alkaliphilus]GGB73641.1 TonB-dependent receptor [Glycocaulis alkaliphilus]
MFSVSILALSAALASETGDISDIVTVTGTRVPVTAERLALRVDTLDRDTIEVEGLTDLVSALSRYPGFSVVQSGGIGATSSIFARGTNSKHTLVLFDGIRVNDASTPSGQFDAGQDSLGDLDRVEIARGPLSSLYGSDAIGGVINLVPRRGGDSEFSPYLDLSAGSFNTIRLLAGASGTTGALEYGLSAERYQSDGFNVTPARMALSGNERDGGEITTITANAAYDFGNGFTLSGIVRHRESTSDFDTFSGGPGFSQRADDPGLELSRNDQTLWRAGLGWQSTDARFTSALRLGEVRNDRESSASGAVTDTYAARRSFVEWLNTWQPQGFAALEPVVAFGVQAERDSINTATAWDNPLSRSENNVGAYLNIQALAADMLDLSGSLRVDDFDGFGTQTTWSLGAVWSVPQTPLQLFARYATAFKAPTLSERFVSSAFTTPNPDLQPEEAESWEVGARASFVLEGGRQASVSLSYFETDIDNLIENVFDFVTFTGSNQNVGRAELSGVEAAGTLDLTASLQLDVDYAYVEATNAVTGTPLLRRPRHAWSAGLVWRPVEALSLSARYQRTGSRRDVTYNDDGFYVSGNAPVAGYELVNVSGQWRFSEQLSAYVTVTNAFDTVYEQPAAFAGAPRMFMAGVRVSY